MKRTLLYLAPVLAVLAVVPTPVRADISWETDDVYRLEWTHNIPASILVADNETNAGVTLSQEAGNYGGNTKFIASNLQTLSAGTTTNPSLLINGGWYDLTVTITDRATGESTTHTFANNKLGVDSFDPNRNYPVGTSKADKHDGASFGKNFSLLEHQFGTGSPWTWSTSKGATYVIWLDRFTPVDAQSATGKGAIGGRAQYIAPGTVQKVPEPSSLLMGAFGLSLAGGAWLRKRRQAIEA